MSRLLKDLYAQESKQVEPTDEAKKEQELALESISVDLEDRSHKINVESLRLEALEDAANTLVDIGVSVSQIPEENFTGFTKEAYQCSLESALPELEYKPNEDQRSFVRRILDALKKFWNGVVQTAKRIGRMLVDFFERVFGGTELLRKKHNRIINRLKELQGYNERAVVPKTDTISISRASVLQFKGELSFNAIANGASIIFEELYPSSNNLANAINTYYTQEFDKYTDEITRVRSLEEKLRYSFEKSKKVDEDFHAKVQKEEIMRNGQPLPGNHVLRIDEPQVKQKVLDDEILQYKEYSRPRIEKDTESRDIGDRDVEIDMPVRLQDIDAVMVISEELFKQLNDAESRRRALSKAMDRRLDRDLSELIRQDTEGEITKIQAMKEAFIAGRTSKLVEREEVRFLMEIDRLTFRYMNAFLNAVEKIINNYELAQA